MSRRSGSVGALVAVASLALAGTASAATEVGNLCEGTLKSGSEITAVQLDRASSSVLPLTAPSAGVVTSWRVNVTQTTEEFPQRLKVLRGSGPTQFSVVGESAIESPSGGINIFKTRIPVEAGDRFGAAGTVIFCKTSLAGDVIGQAVGNAALGSSPSFGLQVPKELVSVTASVEPDADRDGYGDETQDLCPVSASTQASCPPVIHQATAIIKKGAVLVLVTTSGPSSVSVGATVKLPKGAVARLAPVKRQVAPPKIGRFLLKLTGKVKRALAELAPGESLPLTAKATVTDGIGRTDTANGKFKLR